ncbi:hypothetical protein BQ8482_310079 [Mesorhizobium delmotii]|uniref:Uncharacterized protein n=1 Tax=Mesorhizobium delmotii TaxID=1631247 RepID=A0A2P9ANM5_9HYPH|nr:hypothetical protein BQ8482_310079 [Mesorhizobium delmotii]
MEELGELFKRRRRESIGGGRTLKGFAQRPDDSSRAALMIFASRLQRPLFAEMTRADQQAWDDEARCVFNSCGASF